ncbi:MAG: protease complex subunit PrcB family protein [Gemmatimonadales bacterium]
MFPRRCALFLPLAGLIACAGGTTMRVAQDDNGNEQPVSLAPTPVSDYDSTASDTAAATAPVANQPPVEQARAEPPQAEPSRQEQGYGAYGNDTSLDIRRIGQWSRTGVSESRRLVIRDANAWAEFWSELGVGDRPAVDFTRDVALAVTAGQRATGGYEIAIDRVRQQAGDLLVEVVETTPGPNCMTSAALTQPADVVVVPGVSAKSWSFVERKEVRGCH